MSKYLVRLVAVLLIPCLLAETLPAVPASLPPVISHYSSKALFNRQALWLQSPGAQYSGKQISTYVRNRVGVILGTVALLAIGSRAVQTHQDYPSVQELRINQTFIDPAEGISIPTHPLTPLDWSRFENAEVTPEIENQFREMIGAFYKQINAFPMYDLILFEKGKEDYFLRTGVPGIASTQLILYVNPREVFRRTPPGFMEFALLHELAHVNLEYRLNGTGDILVDKVHALIGYKSQGLTLFNEKPRDRKLEAAIWRAWGQLVEADVDNTAAAQYERLYAKPLSPKAFDVLERRSREFQKNYQNALNSMKSEARKAFQTLVHETPLLGDPTKKSLRVSERTFLATPRMQEAIQWEKRNAGPVSAANAFRSVLEGQSTAVLKLLLELLQYRVDYRYYDLLTRLEITESEFTREDGIHKITRTPPPGNWPETRDMQSIEFQSWQSALFIDGQTFYLAQQSDIIRQVLDSREANPGKSPQASRKYAPAAESPLIGVPGRERHIPFGVKGMQRRGRFNDGLIESRLMGSQIMPSSTRRRGQPLTVASHRRMDDAATGSRGSPSLPSELTALKNYLHHQGNSAENIDKTVAMLETRTDETPVVLEVGAGRAAAAHQIARLNPTVRVIAVDTYDKVFPKYQMDWRQGYLLGQEQPLANLVILRASLNVVNLLPRHALSGLLFVNPNEEMEVRLGELFWDNAIQNKLRPGGFVFVKPYYSADRWPPNKDRSGRFPADVHFVRHEPLFLKVDLNRFTDFPEASRYGFVWRVPKPYVLPRRTFFGALAGTFVAAKKAAGQAFPIPKPLPSKKLLQLPWPKTFHPYETLPAHVLDLVSSMNGKTINFQDLITKENTPTGIKFIEDPDLLQQHVSLYIQDFISDYLPLILGDMVAQGWRSPADSQRLEQQWLDRPSNEYMLWLMGELFPEYFAHYGLDYVVDIGKAGDVNMPYLSICPVLRREESFTAPVGVEAGGTVTFPLLTVGPSLVRELDRGPSIRLYAANPRTGEVAYRPDYLQNEIVKQMTRLHKVVEAYPSIQSDMPFDPSKIKNASLAAAWKLMLRAVQARSGSKSIPAPEELFRILQDLAKEMILRHEAFHMYEIQKGLGHYRIGLESMGAEVRANVASVLRSPAATYAVGFQIDQAILNQATKTELDDNGWVVRRMAYLKWREGTWGRSLLPEWFKRNILFTRYQQVQTWEAIGRMNDAELSDLYRHVWEELTQPARPTEPTNWLHWSVGTGVALGLTALATRWYLKRVQQNRQNALAEGEKVNQPSKPGGFWKKGVYIGLGLFVTAFLTRQWGEANQAASLAFLISSLLSNKIVGASFLGYASSVTFGQSRRLKWVNGVVQVLALSALVLGGWNALIQIGMLWDATVVERNAVAALAFTEGFRTIAVLTVVLLVLRKNPRNKPPPGSGGKSKLLSGSLKRSSVLLAQAA